MTLTLWQWELVPWCVFLGYWFISALRLKRTKREEPPAGRLLHIALLVVAFNLLFARSFEFGFLRMQFVPNQPVFQYAGIALTFLGVAFSIWARYSIGENWSGRVTLKIDHQLIRSGPYAYVRHPIYTGLIVACTGAALFIGQVRCIAGLMIAIIEFCRKARKEEGFMVAEFGETYEQYRKRSGFLVPRLRRAA